MLDQRRRRLALLCSLYVGFVMIYGAAAADRLLQPPLYNHYTYLADSFLHGQLELVRPPPHQNDWASFEGRWYVSFPPVPALLMTPFVAIWGWDAGAPSGVPDLWQQPGTAFGRYIFSEPLFTILFAPLPPLLLFLVLERLRRDGRSIRTGRENLLFTALFGLGTVYFSSAVQLDTWHIAHVFGCAFLGLYVLAALDGRHPVLAGLSLGLAFGCRTPTIFALVLFAYELARSQGVTRVSSVAAKLRALATPRVVIRWGLFTAVLGGLVGAWLLMNEARFGDPFDFGHSHLAVRWVPRIERWGLFDLHYLPRNLAAAFVLTPWATEEPPFLQLSQHGLAIWLTTPALFYVLWPRKRTVEVMRTPPLVRRFWPEWYPDLIAPLALCVAAVALPSLLYQNTGWVQFGYRFSNDYMLFLVMLLAVGGRPITRLFRALIVLSVVINLFGALTFNRVASLYDQDMSQQVFFEPD